MGLDRPHLTRRGAFVVGAVILALLMGHAFGGRGLNAVVMPAAALLGIGAVQVARAEPPSVARRAPANGHVDDRLSVSLEVRGQPTVAVTVVDDLPDGVRGDARFETIADGRTLRYEATLARRGVHTLGPVRIAVRDFFGLWERTVVDAGTDRLVAFPRIHPLHESAGLLSGYVGLTDHREQFDGIREYQPGDALRNVNWKASAKYAGELVVTEYAGEGAHNRVTVGVTADAHRADSAAEAAASVADHLLEHGLSVGLVTDRESLAPGTGETHRRRLLTALARFEGGRDDDRHLDDDVDVVMHAPHDGRHVRISVAGDTRRFNEVLASQRGVAA